MYARLNCAILQRKHQELVDVLLAGHCNEGFSEEINGVNIIGSGSHWRSYSRIDITFDTQAEEITAVNTTLAQVEFNSADKNAIAANEEMTALVERWQAEVEVELTEEVGYANPG